MTGFARPRANLASFLDDLAADPKRPAVVARTPYRRASWTSGEVVTAALHVARRLKDAGAAPGERVLLEGPDGPGWVAAFFGIVAAGCVVVPLEHASPPGFARRVAERTGARSAIVTDALASTLDGLVPARIRIEEAARWKTAAEAAVTPHRAAPEDTAEIVFTSGTTAEPKGVELSHRNLLASLAGIEAGFRRREAWLRPLLPMRFLCVLPLSHLFGQSLGILVPILMRSTSVFPASPEPARLLRSIRAERPLAVITVPRVLGSLRASILRELDRSGKREALERRLAEGARRGFLRRAWNGRPVRSILGWRTWALVSGGAALDPEVEVFWRGCGFFVIQGYGMTEAAPVIAVQNPLDGSVRTLGRPLKDVEVRIAEDGEVLVRGPNVMKGYWNDPQATREALREGWLRTGDLAERDASGRLYFKGRKKDVIVLAGGLNVHPSDVEAALQTVAGVREAVAFAQPGPNGDEVHAAVLLDDPRASIDGIRAAANERLAPHQAVRRLFAWDTPDFPRTATGKVRRGEVAAAARLLEPSSAPASHGAGRVSAALARIRGDLAGPPEARARLVQDLGLDSLDVLELVAQLEEENEVAVEEEALSPSATLGDLERLVGSAPEKPPQRVRMPRFSRSLPVRAVRTTAWDLLLRPLFSVFVHLTVRGRENVPRGGGPFLVVANHASLLDTPAVRAALPRFLRSRLYPAMAVEVLPAHFEPERHGVAARVRSGALYVAASTLFGAYPMPQSRGYRPSLEYTGELLDAGLCPLVFPEGQMTRTGEMLPFKSGIGLLALETEALVLPIHLDGLFEILPPESRWPRWGKAVATIGRPFAPAENGGDPATVARRIESAVRALSSRRNA